MKILRVQWFEMVAQLLAVLVLALLVQAQQPGSASSASAEIPKLIRYSAIAKDEAGKPMSGTVGITFALYKDQQGGAALWVETQNVQADSTGHYQVMLGAASSAGLPFDIFAGGEARWLGVQIAGQAEQSRVMLASVPYAMKAGDAATVGGLPASAFVKKSGGGVQQAGIGDSPQSATGKTMKSPSGTGVTQCSAATGFNC